MVFESVVERAVDAHGARNGVVCHRARDTAARSFIDLVDSTGMDCSVYFYLIVFENCFLSILQPKTAH